MSTRYTKDHEWIRLDGEVATVGITEHAQSQLGDIVYVELPEIGRKIEKAVDMRASGVPIAIVGESHWAEHLRP